MRQLFSFAQQWRSAPRLWFTACALAALMLMGSGSGIAQAHPTLLFTEPVTQTAVPASPDVITLLFNEPVTIGSRPIVLLDQSGREVAIGPASLAREARFVAAAPTRALAPGLYTVRWRVTGADGDQVEQDYKFAVGVTLSVPATSTAGNPAWVESALRWLLFAALAVAVGGLVARRVTDSARAIRPALPPVQSWAPAAILLALTASLALLGQRMVDAPTLTAGWDGRAGALLLIETGGLLIALTLVKLGRWALAPLAIVIAADAIRSHAGTTVGAWGAALTGVHLAAAAIWVGALVHTLRAVLAWRPVPSAVRWVLVSYVRLALVTYLAVVATGVISALTLVPLPQLFSTTYGTVLLIKIGLVAAASAAALSARRLRRDPHRSTRLRRLMAAEAAILVVVLGASAVLVSTPPPTGSASTAAAPPPSGPVLPLGALAGQVGISVTASEGLLVVLLSTPRHGDYYAPEHDQQYILAVSVGDSALALTGCGSGCFYARPAWHNGENVLTLRAEAIGWAGAATALIVSWPPQPGGGDLAAAVAATRAAGTVTVYETVTSDTSIKTPEPNRLDVEAGFFLSQELCRRLRTDRRANLARRGASAPGARLSRRIHQR